jgi:ABC-type Na+ efflux pump permease subunit
MKWWLIAWREIRWEVFLDRASLLRTSIFVVIPLFFVLTNRGIPPGAAGDATLLGLALQSAFFPALSGVALIAATFTAEKENGTLVPLLAAPIRDFDIVLGKLVGMVVPVMVTCAVTLAAGYALAAYRYGGERVARALTPELLYAVLVLALLYLVTTGSITMIVAARVRSSRAAQQIAGLIIGVSAAVFAGLGFVAARVGEGWPLLIVGAVLVLFDVVALELARRVWQRGEVIGRV